MVTGEVTETQLESSGVRLTVTPGAGAAKAEPALSNWMVISTGKPALKVAEDWIMFRLAVVVASVVSAA